MALKGRAAHQENPLDVADAPFIYLQEVRFDDDYRRHASERDLRVRRAYSSD